MQNMHLKMVYTIVEKCDKLKLNIQHALKAVEDKPVKDEKEVIRKNSSSIKQKTILKIVTLKYAAVIRKLGS